MEPNHILTEINRADGAERPGHSPSSRETAAVFPRSATSDAAAGTRAAGDCRPGRLFRAVTGLCPGHPSCQAHQPGDHAGPSEIGFELDGSNRRRYGLYRRVQDDLRCRPDRHHGGRPYHRMGGRWTHGHHGRALHRVPVQEHGVQRPREGHEQRRHQPLSGRHRQGARRPSRSSHQSGGRPHRLRSEPDLDSRVVNTRHHGIRRGVQGNRGC